MSSCGTANSFSRQKYTKLRPLDKQESETVALKNSDAALNIGAVGNEFLLDDTVKHDPEHDPILNQIKYSIEAGHAIVIDDRGKHYQLNKASLQDGTCLTGVLNDSITPANRVLMVSVESYNDQGGGKVLIECENIKEVELLRDGKYVLLKQDHHDAESNEIITSDESEEVEEESDPFNYDEVESVEDEESEGARKEKNQFTAMMVFYFLAAVASIALFFPAIPFYIVALVFAQKLRTSLSRKSGQSKKDKRRWFWTTEVIVHGVLGAIIGIGILIFLFN